MAKGDASDLQPAVLELWRHLLDQPDLDEDADFFVNGGHSLLAARLLQRVRRLLGVRIPLSALMSAPTPRSFTQRLLVLRDGAEQAALRSGPPPRP